MEKLELYDKNRNLTGDIITRGDLIPKGKYKLVAAIWIENTKGEYLIQKRAKCKHTDAGKWAFTGGHADIGEDTEKAIIRETKEELGIDVKGTKRVFTIIGEEDIADLYYIKKDMKLEDMILQKDEVEEVRWVTIKELDDYVKSGQFAPMHMDFYNQFKIYLEDKKDT